MSAESRDDSAEGTSGWGGRYRREGRGLEFDRVSFFTDAVFAIALTIIVVGIEVPHLVDPASTSELIDKLDDIAVSAYVFFLAFYIIGRFWMANHAFVKLIEWVDATYISWVLVYLAFVAFLPFPAALMGNYSQNPVAVATFAVAMASVCLLETVLITVAQRHRLYRRQFTPVGFRWTVIGSLSPVVVFLGSIPVMFLISSYVGMFCWLVTVPLGVAFAKTKPDEVYVAESAEGQSTS